MGRLRPFLRIQVLPDDQRYTSEFLMRGEPDSEWYLLLPFIVALFSIAILVSGLGARIFESQRRNIPTTNPGIEARSAFRRIVTQNGGTTVFLFMIARILGCIALVGLSIPPILKEVSQKDWSSLLGCVDETLLLVNTYALVLSSIALLVPNWRKWLIHHNVVILLTEFCVYVYRDVWPLATFSETPQDHPQGWLLWAKISALAFTAVIIPVTIPTLYSPLDPKTCVTELHPEQTASLLSFFTFSYLTPTIAASRTTDHLRVDQLPPMADYDKAQALADRAQPYLDLIKVRKERHIAMGLLRLFASDFVLQTIALTIYAVGRFATPAAVNRLLTALESSPTQRAVVRPWFWIAGILIAPLISSMAIHSYSLVSIRCFTRVESILTQLTFDHSLRVRVKAESSETADEAGINVGVQQGKGAPSFTGKVNNLITSDLSNIAAGRDFIFVCYFLPLQIVCCTTFLYAILGWSALVGVATMILLLPLPGILAQIIQDIQGEKMKKTDNRTQTVIESMNVIRMIKLFSWENKIREKVAKRREEELNLVWRGKLFIILVMVITSLIPTITMLVTYAIAALAMKIELTAAKIFSSMILFDMMRTELERSTYTLYLAIRAKVSIDRFNEFFKETELLDSNEPSDLAVPHTVATENDDFIGFRDAIFTWTPRESQDHGASTPSNQFKLNIPGDLHFVKGKINLIVGPTGSGKTSLLMALLGEMRFTPTQPTSTFSLPRANGVSLAVQESWVQNATIRDNILFHSPYDEQRYKKVLSQCGLEPDLELFEAGDQTEVGERGLTLSGGQKARLTLARAIYSKTEMILLDDVFAALDVHTSVWIVNKCLKGELVQGRTVLLVTHNIALASPIAHFIVSITRDGVVTSRGQDISAVLLEEPELQAEYDQGGFAVAAQEDIVLEKSFEESKPSGKLILEEEIQRGNVSMKAIKFLVESLGGQHVWLFFLLWLGGYVAGCGIQAFGVWFLGLWSSQYELHPIEEIPITWYLGTYIGLVLLTTLVIITRDIWYTLGMMRASRNIHNILYESVIGATLRWLDETPVSRIITRMTQDMQSVDGPVMETSDRIANLAIVMVVALLSSVLFVPVFILLGLLIAMIGIYVGSFYLKAQLSVKRELSNAKAPMLAHFGETMGALVSIRAYGAEPAFKKKSMRQIDNYVALTRTNNDLNRWIGVRIDALGAIFTSSLAAYLSYRSGLSAANVGFSLNRAVEFTSVILYVVRYFNMFQVEANSLERIVAYTEIEQEPKPTETGKPPASWPTSGDIRVENLTARYSQNGPAILHNLSFDIRSGERIGIVGRTGSGKSSLTLALLRLILTDGTVYFDGLPTNGMNLDALRSKVTIIPQLPELLSGTLRYNLDPFEEYDDITLNGALRSSGLYGSQGESEESRLTLDSNIASSGANVSVGQRQIIALARAIVRSSKLLILDEATSAIDHETDTVIQNTLRQELGSDVTVLTIAHRLQTIADADRIMVLDAGLIVEFAPPAELLAKSGGTFKALVDESVDKEYLYQVAEKSLSSSSQS